MTLILGTYAISVATFCLVIGDFSWLNLLIGSVLSLLLMWVFRKQVFPEELPPNAQALHILTFVPVLAYYLLIDIIKGTWQVSRITLGIDDLRRPGIIKVSFENYTHYAVGPIGFFVTLSPGSFLVDVDWDERVLLIHVVDASDPDAVRRDAEKYLRLWEYHPANPIIDDETEDDNE